MHWDQKTQNSLGQKVSDLKQEEEKAPFDLESIETEKENIQT